MVFAIFAGWTTNNGNLYSAAQAVQGTFLNFKQKVWSMGGIVSVLSSFSTLDSLIPALDLMGIVVGELGAIVLGAFSVERVLRKKSLEKMLCYICILLLWEH